MKGVLIGMVFAFILLCIREAVVQYRFERKMLAMLRRDVASMGHIKWVRARRVTPLFWEQRWLAKRQRDE